MATQNFQLSDIPLGICCNCGLEQTQPGQGGFWINGLTKKWACTQCKYGLNGNSVIRSYPIACEWCTYTDVKFCQGHCYNCPRCDALKIDK